jgi:Zn-dependent oligopeptidase
MFTTLSKSQKKMITAILAELQKEGIHLSEAERQKLVALNSHISELTTSFLHACRRVEPVTISVRKLGVLAHTYDLFLISYMYCIYAMSD